MGEKKERKKKISDILTGTQVIALGFLAVILAGTLLLMLPCMNRNGVWTSFVDALFMSTTSVCVTGLTLVTDFAYWTIFGQIVILVLIQIGGIGVVAMTILLLMIFKKKVSLKRISGGNGIEEPPVPIPNTEVKLNCVDGTWRATSRESRTLPDFFF